MVKNKAKEDYYILQNLSMKVSGSMIKFMAKESSNIVMGIHIGVIMYKVGSVEMVCISQKMVWNILVNEIMTRKMAVGL